MSERNERVQFRLTSTLCTIHEDHDRLYLSRGGQPPTELMMIARKRKDQDEEERQWKGVVVHPSSSFVVHPSVRFDEMDVVVRLVMVV